MSYITVTQLIQLLSQEDGNRVVLISSDPEGNGFAPLITPFEFCSYSEAGGCIGLEVLTPELEQQGYTDEDVVQGIPALCLYPG